MSFRRLVGGAVSWHVMHLLCVQPVLPDVAPRHLDHECAVKSRSHASVDLHVTQDVLKHVFHPEKVFKKIARTLKPDGIHIFSVPIVRAVEAWCEGEG